MYPKFENYSLTALENLLIFSNLKYFCELFNLFPYLGSILIWIIRNKKYFTSIVDVLKKKLPYG